MAVEKLRCRVCENEFPAIASGACLHCFGPLDPVYDWDARGLRQAEGDVVAAGDGVEAVVLVPRVV